MGDIIETLMNAAKENLKKSKSLAPAAIVSMPDGSMMPMIMAFSNDEEKVIFRDTFKTFIKGCGSTEYCTIMETWMSAVDLEKNPEDALKMPRLNPNKKEAIVIVQYKKDVKPRMGICIFKRDLNNEFIFDPVVITDTSLDSYWDIFVDESKIDESFNKSREIARKKFLKGISKELSGKYYQEFKAAKTEIQKIRVINKIIKEGQEKIQDKMKTLEDNDGKE